MFERKNPPRQKMAEWATLMRDFCAEVRAGRATRRKKAGWGTHFMVHSGVESAGWATRGPKDVGRRTSTFFNLPLS